MEPRTEHQRARMCEWMFNDEAMGKWKLEKNEFIEN